MLKILILLLSIWPVYYANALNKHSTLKIAIVDTGLDLNDPRFNGHICTSGHKNFVDDDYGINDVQGHGTHVTGLIEKYAGDGSYCFLIYKYYQEKSPGYINEKNEVLAIQEAVDNKADIVNISAGGPIFNEQEALIIKNNPKIIFVVAAGNEGQNLDIPGNEFYPASLFYSNMFVVGSVDIDGNKTSSSNYGKKVVNKELGKHVLSYLPNQRVGYMSGTSQATAIFSGKLVAKKLKTCNYR